MKNDYECNKCHCKNDILNYIQLTTTEVTFINHYINTLYINDKINCNDLETKFNLLIDYGKILKSEGIDIIEVFTLNSMNNNTHLYKYKRRT